MAEEGKVDYDALLLMLEDWMVGEKRWLPVLANTSALLWQEFHKIPRLASTNWLGFYLTTTGFTEQVDSPELVLGPFQGKAACTTIPRRKGVCGTAAQTRRSVLVPDVHEFPGHIACDDASQSEIVVPLIHPTSGVLLGVLDIDSAAKATFTEHDLQGLERVAKFISSLIDWPSQPFTF